MTDAPREPGFYWVKWYLSEMPNWTVSWLNPNGWYYGDDRVPFDPAVIGPRIEPPE